MKLSNNVKKSLHIFWTTCGTFNVSEHYINFNSTHRIHWLGFDLKVFSSIYLTYQLHSIFTYN